MGADLSPFAFRGKILQPYKPSSLSQPPPQLPTPLPPRRCLSFPIP